MDLDRRALIGGAALTGAALAAPAVLAMQRLEDLKKEADVACLYHCDFGDVSRFQQLVQNIANHYSVYGNPLALQLAVVVHGQGLKFFLDGLDGTPWKDERIDPAIFQRVTDQSKNGLKVYLCNITFERLKISRDKAHKADFISLVPSGVAAVAALQAKGFGYLKVG